MIHVKRFVFLLTLVACAAGQTASAQPGTDTSFTFYFRTDHHTTDTLQQKAFEAFLQKIRRIKTINSYTDTTGTWAHNEKLSRNRAYEVYHLLPTTLKDVEIVSHVETNAYPQLWQNRRVDVVATLTAADTLHTTALPGETVAELNLEHILFIPDQPVITEASLEYVKQLAQQLRQYPRHRFEIVGHVNYPYKLSPEKLKNLYELSEKRAEAVYDLLAQHGIARERMRYKGVGNSQPVIENATTLEEKRKNMRVQLFIIQE